ncbi:MAG: hypothetical protein HY650_11640 [Acidobacteria bacterium]|nr:hypothetical protein [Acidobacteriota bacterium]
MTMDRISQRMRIVAVFFLGAACAAGWSGIAQSGTGNAAPQGSGTGRGTAVGRPAPGTMSQGRPDKSEMKRKASDLSATREGQSQSNFIPPGPRTGEYLLASGYYSVGTHDLGVIDAGTMVTIEVEATSSGMDLIAIVDEPDVTVEQGRFFSDDDSGGDLDPAIRFIAPVTGNYVLRIRDINQRSGFYRYRISLF